MPTFRTEVKALSLLTLWLLFCAGYFGRFPLPGIFGKLYLMALAGIIAASAGGFGSLVLRHGPRQTISAAESALLSISTGFGIMSLLMVLAGAFGLWTRNGALIIIVGGLLLAWPYRLQAPTLAASMRDAFRGISTVPACLMISALILSVLLAFSPATYYDTLVYHFALPQSYIQAGHWVGRQELIYSAFPQNMEMLWTLGMLLAGDLLANLLGMEIAVLGVLAVFLYAERRLGKHTASWAAALLATMPAYLLLSSGGYVDAGLAVFSFMSFYAATLWQEQKSAPMLLLSGILAGLAMGCKYTGAIPAAIVLLMILVQSRSEAIKTVAARKLIFAAAAVLAFSPWLIKNIFYVGNPVFPFFASWNFRSLNPWMSGAAEGYFRGLTEYAPRSGWNLIRLLWDIAVNGMNFGGGMDVLGDLGWAPLFVFLPALGLVRKLDAAVRPLLAYCLLFYLAWALTRPVLRFLLPIAPFLAMAGAYGYTQGVGSQSRWVQTAGRTLMALLLFSSAHLFMNVSDALSLFHVPLGIESRTDYMRHVLVNNYYPAATFMNQTLPDNSLTYIVGDQRGYYYNKPVLVTPVFNKNPLTEWANSAASPEALKARLKEQGVTHLMINKPELERLDPIYHIFPFTPKGQSNWGILTSRLTTSLYQENGCQVLAL